MSRATLGAQTLDFTGANPAIRGSRADSVTRHPGARSEPNARAIQLGFWRSCGGCHAYAVEAKLRLCELHDGCGLTELEEGWLVRSLYREDGLSQPEIARRMSRHKSWVWRRLMLVEALDTTLQADVRLGLLSARAAVAVSRLPRGNQQAAGAVVLRRGLTVRQTELLVEEMLEEQDPQARAALLLQRLDKSGLGQTPGPRPSRAVRNEADWMSADVLKTHTLAARLSARLAATPLEAFTPAAAELLHDALVRLSPVLRALDAMIGAVTHDEGAA
jgi:hypothetical protein